MTSETPILTGNDTLPTRQPWVYAEMLPKDNGNGYHDLSGEFGSFPISDGDRRTGVELTNLQWLQIAAVNAKDANGSIKVLFSPEYLGQSAQAHNQRYVDATTRERAAMSGLIGAVLVWGITEQQLQESLLTYDPLQNNSDI